MLVRLGSAMAIASVPGEPVHVLALPRRGRRIHRRAVEQIAQVEVGVAVGDVVDADVGEFGRPAEVLDVHPGLLDDLAPSRLPRRLAGIEVPTRLQPRADLEMAQQHDAARRRRRIRIR